MGHACWKRVLMYVQNTNTNEQSPVKRGLNAHTKYEWLCSVKVVLSTHLLKVSRLTTHAYL